MGGLIKVAIERPVAVLALILLTVLFGVVALRNIPIQMSPTSKSPFWKCGSGGPALRLRMSTVKSWRGWKASCPALTG